MRGGLLRLVQTVGDLGGDDRLADGLAHLFKELAVLGALNGLGARAQKTGAALAQDALALELHGHVQAGLPPDAGDDGVGALIAQNLGDVFQGQRLHIDLVGDLGVGHDGGGVRVDQHYLIALFLQGETGLGAGVVKLGRLPDDDGTRADDQNLFDIRTFSHVVHPPRCKSHFLYKPSGDSGR